MNEKQLIHVKIERFDAIDGKKDTLSIEMNLLKIVKTIRRYELLRTQELKLKLKMYNKIKDLKTNLKRLQVNLPKIQLSKIEKEEKEETRNILKENRDDVDTQLRRIQEKLNFLTNQ